MLAKLYSSITTPVTTIVDCNFGRNSIENIRTRNRVLILRIVLYLHKIINILVTSTLRRARIEDRSGHPERRTRSTRTLNIFITNNRIVFVPARVKIKEKKNQILISKPQYQLLTRAM